MMKTTSLRYLAALALACCGLASCNLNGGGPADVTNPTVSQLDDLDVRGGLLKRVSKNGNRRGSAAAASHAATKTSDAGATEAAAGSTDAQAAPAKPATTGTVSEEVKSKLR